MTGMADCSTTSDDPAPNAGSPTIFTSQDSGNQNLRVRVLLDRLQLDVGTMPAFELIRGPVDHVLTGRKARRCVPTTARFRLSRPARLFFEKPTIVVRSARMTAADSSGDCGSGAIGTGRGARSPTTTAGSLAERRRQGHSEPRTIGPSRGPASRLVVLRESGSGGREKEHSTGDQAVSHSADILEQRRRPGYFQMPSALRTATSWPT